MRLGPGVRAALSLAAVESDLARKGWLVYRASAAGGPADLVADRDGRWLRFRVRTSREDARGRVAVPVPGDADVLAVVVPGEPDRVIFFPTLDEVRA